MGRRVRFSDSVPGGRLADCQEYSVQIDRDEEVLSQLTFNEICDELLGRMSSTDVTARRRSLVHIRGRVVSLARTCRGSQVLQKAVEIAGRGEEQRALVEELQDHVPDLALTYFGSQVLQAFLRVLPFGCVDFIHQELEVCACSVARHEYGHAVLCRIIENMPMTQTMSLSETLLRTPGGIPELCKNVFGRLVVQSILDYGPQPAQESVRRALAMASAKEREHQIQHAVCPPMSADVDESEGGPRPRRRRVASW